MIKFRPRQGTGNKYKVARKGVELGDFSKSELLKQYLDQNIKLTDHIWRAGLTEWRTLYDLFTEFLQTPEQWRAYDRELQMTTKTSYRLKYLLSKSASRISEKRKTRISFNRQQRKLKKDIEKLRIKAANEKDPDKLYDFNSDLNWAEDMIEANNIGHEGRDDNYFYISDESKEEMAQLKCMRVVFWQTTFEGNPPKMSKKDVRALTNSYETRVSQILRGLVPWSTNYFELGSLFSMPSSRALYEAHGKNFIRPAENQIKQILKKLDEETPDWDDKNPEIFYLDLKPINPT